MDPFQKRDRILRTPPGQSYLDRSSSQIAECSSINGTTDCLVYDESGMLNLSWATDALKQYTITFNAAADGNQFVNTRLSWMCDPLQKVYTSSPVRPRLNSKKSCLVASTQTPATVSAGPPVTQISTFNEVAQEDKENFNPDIPSIVLQRPTRRKLAKDIGECSVECSGSSDASLGSTTSVRHKGRRLRSHDSEERNTEVSGMRTLRSRKTRKPESPPVASTRTVRARKRLTAPPSSHSVRTPSIPVNKSPSTPTTVIFKAPSTPITIVHCGPCQTVENAVTPATIVPRRRGRPLKVPISTRDEEKSGFWESNPVTVVRAQIATSPSTRTGAAMVPPPNPNLDESAISTEGCGGRRRKLRTGDSLSFEPDMEPIACRLRRRNTVQSTHLDSSLSRSSRA